MGILRALLAISVLIQHSDTVLGVRLLGGDMAVTGFYIVSGFLITLILREKYTHETAVFYLNRFLRIYVPYLGALVFSIVVFASIDYSSSFDPFRNFERASAAGNDLWIVWSAISNLTLVGMDLIRYIQLTPDLGGIEFPNFLHDGTAGGENLLFVPQAWTLAIELQFYLLAPFLMRRLNAFWLLVATATLFVLTTNIYEDLRLANVPIDPSAIFAMQLQYFLLGGLAYHGFRYLRAWSIPHAVKRAVAIPVWILAIVMIIRGYPLVAGEELRTFQFFYVAFAATLPFAFYLSKDWHWDHRVGDYSYPIYLFHFAVAAAVFSVAPDTESYGEVVLVLTLVVCTVFLFTVDRPLQNLRRRIARRAGVSGPAVLNEPATVPATTNRRPALRRSPPL
jgi:peptidoglycan/LPS O-acetylase OafA/YrhL